MRQYPQNAATGQLIGSQPPAWLYWLLVRVRRSIGHKEIKQKYERYNIKDQDYHLLWLEMNAYSTMCMWEFICN
jgi:hypothetical protein